MQEEKGESICPRLLLPAPLHFSSCTHNFLNPEIGLNILFEKGHRGYRK